MMVRIEADCEFCCGVGDYRDVVVLVLEESVGGNTGGEICLISGGCEGL